MHHYIELLPHLYFIDLLFLFEKINSYYNSIIEYYKIKTLKESNKNKIIFENNK